MISDTLFVLESTMKTHLDTRKKNGKIISITKIDPSGPVRMKPEWGKKDEYCQ